MQKPIFPHPITNKRFNTLNTHLRDQHGIKVFKVPLNAGFTCPNIDGTVAYGGCTFCSIKGSGDFAGCPSQDLVTQFHDIKAKRHKKWPKAKYIAYFQAFTNTHAPVEVLRDKYETVLKADPNIVGISIGTRPDCLPDDVVEYLGELATRTNLWVELGLQTIHESTSKLINRAHSYDTFLEGVDKLRKKNIETIVHIINGLPRETDEMMMETAREVGKLDVQGIKIHLLHVMRMTPMATMLKKNMMELMEQDHYVDLVVRQLEVLHPEMIIHRLTGDAPEDMLLGPMWSLKKMDVLNAIDKLLQERNTYQGRLYVP